MTKQLDETSNDRKNSRFWPKWFQSRNWEGRHPQNDQILKRPRKSTYLIPPELPWKFQQKIFTTKKIRIGNMLGGKSRLPPTYAWLWIRALTSPCHELQIRGQIYHKIDNWNNIANRKVVETRVFDETVGFRIVWLDCDLSAHLGRSVGWRLSRLLSGMPVIELQNPSDETINRGWLIW